MGGDVNEGRQNELERTHLSRSARFDTNALKAQGELMMTVAILLYLLR